MGTGPSTAWFMGFSTGAAKPEKAKPGAAKRALCLILFSLGTHICPPSAPSPWTGPGVIIWLV